MPAVGSFAAKGSNKMLHARSWLLASELRIGVVQLAIGIQTS